MNYIQQIRKIIYMSNILLPITFDVIDNEIFKFKIANGQEPTQIIMHPLDGQKFMQLMHDTFGYNYNDEFKKYNGITMLKSLDVEEGKWILKL